MSTVRAAQLQSWSEGTSTGEPEAAQAAAGPHPPVRVLFQHYAPYVWRVLRRMGVAQADVEDVCQEVFVAVARQLPTFEGRSSMRTWLYSIALRQALNYRRRAFRRYETTSEFVGEAPVAPSQTRQLDARRAVDALDAVLDQMDPDRRQVFVLFELEHLPMKEVAQIVGCPLPTAYGRLRSARKQLREAAQALGVLA